MRCIYCGSNSYGKSCIFSPTKTHVHSDEPDKCIYCGSKSIGNGCILNPYGKVHVRAGTIFIQMKEQLLKSAVLSHLFEMVEQTNNLKYNSPLDRLYKRMADTIKKSSEPFLEAFALQDTPILEQLEPQKLEEISDLQKRLREQLSDIRDTLKQANTALPVELVEKVLTSAILGSGERS